MRRCPAIFLVLLAGLACSAAGPLWPLPEDPFEKGQEYPEFVQPTASGQSESALFGCIRNGGNRFHEAIDLAPVLPRSKGEVTDPVAAIYDGVVRHVSRVSGNSSYGRYVVLEHPGQDLAVYSLYAHLSRIEKGLEPGQIVRAGQQIGVMGRSAGGYTIPRQRSHLHLEIGLRLTDAFEEWYRRQGYDTPNQHGPFNGINLVGWDPLDYFQAFREGRAESPLGYIGSLPPAVMLHVFTTRRPDFLERYPELVLPGCEPSEQAGWEVLLSAWGLPLSFKPIRQEDLNGVRNPGDISVVGINREALEAYACRDIIDERGDRVLLGRGGQTLMEILFMPDLRDD